MAAPKGRKALPQARSNSGTTTQAAISKRGGKGKPQHTNKQQQQAAMRGGVAKKKGSSAKGRGGSARGSQDVYEAEEEDPDELKNTSRYDVSAIASGRGPPSRESPPPPDSHAASPMAPPDSCMRLWIASEREQLRVRDAQ
jgi:hypothetical protein